MVSDADPEVVRPGARYVQVDDRRSGGRPIDLLEERDLGGHAIERHVGRSSDSLFNAVRGTVDLMRRRGDTIDNATEGSFSSLEAANKLINSTITENQNKVERVVSGISGREKLDKDFSSPTGREAYARNERSPVLFRETYSVRVIIVRDRTASKGFRVDTAFPRTPD